MFFTLVVLSIFQTLTLSSPSLPELSIQKESMEGVQYENDSIPATSIYDDPDVPESFGILHTLTKLIEWAVAEEEMVKVIIHRQQLIAAELKQIQHYLDDYRETTGVIHKNVKISVNDTREDPRLHRGVVASKPVSGHRTTRRYSVILHQLRELLTCSEYVGNQMKLDDALKFKDKDNWIFSEFVGWDDMYMSMNAFIHFSEVYGFKPMEMTRGLVLDTSAGGTLNAVHVAEIGVFSLFRQKQSLSVDWLESAKTALNSDSSDLSVAMDVLSQYLRVAIQRHNRDLKTLKDASKNNSENVGDEYMTLYMEPVTENEAPESRESVRELFYYHKVGLGNESETEAQFIDLCLGNEPQTPEMQQKLKCFYERKRHPYLTINPIKTEQLSEIPPVLQFYEMVSNLTIELIKRENRPRISLSGVVGTKGVRSVTDYRTSAGTFLPPDEPTPRIIYTLAEAVTGLQITDASEHIQFVEYTYGRFYTFHIDALHNGNGTDVDVVDMGDRLATILYYLNVPDLGGNTPFCAAGVSARPVKGSAILWYNLYRNGSRRMDVMHGSCPVIHGHKIIMNHWVRYNGNWKTFPCSLNQFE